MLPESLKGFPSKALPYVLDKRFFMINLCDSSDDWQKIGKEQIWSTVKRLIVPCFLNANDAYLYCKKDVPIDDHLFEIGNAFLARDRSRYKIEISECVFHEDVKDFWVDFNETRGSVVWLCPYDEAVAASVFEQCLNPIALNNPAAYTGQAVINYARKRVAETDDMMAFVLPYGVTRLFVFTSNTKIESLFWAALNNCQFSKGFISTYSK